MGVFLVDTELREGAERATRHGMVASIIVAAMYAFGLFLIATARYPGAVLIDPSVLWVSYGIIIAQMAVSLAAAYRFYHRKGLVLGGITLLLFAIEIVMKVTGGFVGIFWYVAYLGIFLGLINGLRGAWELRDAPDQLPSDIAQAFE